MAIDTGNNGTMGGDGRGIGERVDQIGHNAQAAWSEARGAVQDLGEKLDLRGRVERNPYGMIAAAIGVGYVLGGGLFTPMTARIVRLGMKLAALPLVKDELIGMAERTVDGLVRGAERVEEAASGGSNPDIPSGV